MANIRLLKKSFLFLLTLFVTYFTIFTHIGRIPAEKKPWTILIYIAGDNDLESFIDADLNEMRQAANKNVHILAFVNTHRPGEQKVSKKLVVNSDKIIQDGPDLLNLDSGKPATVIKAAKWSLENFPSDKFSIIFWDHGSGPLNRDKNLQSSFIGRGVCFDDTTGNYLKDFDLQSILSTIVDIRGKKIEIVAFDACLMANIETSYIAEPFAEYLVASQETVAATGYDYKMFKILEKENLNANTFSSKIIKSYDQCYKLSSEDYTLSAVKLSNIKAVFNNLDQLSQTLINLLKKQQDHLVDRAITNAAFNNPNLRFSEPDYIDLYNFYINLLQNIKTMNLISSESTNLASIIQEGLYLIRRAVSYNATSPRFYAVRGISIYLPKNKIHSSYQNLYWSLQQKWASFLKTYLKSITKA